MGLGREASGSFRDVRKLGPIAAIVPVGYLTEVIKAAALSGKSCSTASVATHPPPFYVGLWSMHLAVQFKLARTGSVFRGEWKLGPFVSDRSRTLGGKFSQ